MTTKNYKNKRNSYIRKTNRKKRRKASRSRALSFRLITIAVIAVCALLILKFTVFDRLAETRAYTNPNGIVFSDTIPSSEDTSAQDLNKIEHNVDITVQDRLLTPNEYSRPGTPLTNINGIVIHYVGNSGSTGEQNRDYFENLQTGESDTYASSHFVIGLDGEIIQCIPLDEISYASNERNSDTISIECCHPDDTGEFTDETYQSLVKLTAWLCEEYSLESDDVIRHYDVTGKNCPKYFVEDEDAWNDFHADLTEMLS